MFALPPIAPDLEAPNDQAARIHSLKLRVAQLELVAVGLYERREPLGVDLYAPEQGLGVAEYRNQHAPCFIVFELMGYAFTGSVLLPLVWLEPCSFINEFIVDMHKPNHPNVDWDQLLFDHLGILIAILLVIALGKVWPPV